VPSALGSLDQQAAAHHTEPPHLLAAAVDRTRRIAVFRVVLRRVSH
jgi:hypothetical protein